MRSKIRRTIEVTLKGVSSNILVKLVRKLARIFSFYEYQIWIQSVLINNYMNFSVIKINSYFEWNFYSEIEDNVA